jgi:TP901 family phage tail tape measure protein
MAVAAGAAGYMALRGPVQQAMAVDERLAHLANTAYRERDVRGKRVGMTELRDAVDAATNRFGGTRAGATGALEELMASGVVSNADAIKMLPELVKAGSAANADPTALAQIALRSMQTFRIEAGDVPNVLNMALAAGQAGGFELKDMARWLPQQMAAATLTGMSGREGFARLAALNQAAAITAGTKDEAGNNVVNLLAKINSRDTAVDAKKLGIDLPRYLQQRLGAGVDGVTAFGDLVS